jgi:heterodisulfide reductase subunit C2
MGLMVDNIGSGCGYRSRMQVSGRRFLDAHARALCKVAGLFRIVHNPLKAGTGALTEGNEMSAEHSSKISPEEHADARPQESLSSQIQNATGLDPAGCYQCGKCSAGCPMANEMELKTHQIIRLLQLDLGERLLSSESIWMCLTCETCTTRCPNQFDPAATIDALREIALKKAPNRVPKRISAFHAAFLDQIRAHGRVFEFGLVASYKLRGGDLFADVESVPSMLSRGKLSFAPKKIKGIKALRRIFEQCATEKSK